MNTMKTFLTITLAAIGLTIAAFAIDFKSLPSPQRYTNNGSIAVRYGDSGYWKYQRLFGDLGDTDRQAPENQQWLIVQIMGEARAGRRPESASDLQATPTNTFICTSHKPTVIYTNQIYYITFE